MSQILVIPSTKKHVSDPVYIYNGAGEGETLYGVSLTLNLTAPATVRLTVSSRQNDTVNLVKDFGYVSYPAGNSVLNVGNALGVIGVNLQFQDVSKFVSVSEGFKSSYELNQAYATVYLNTSDAPGSPSNPFASLADVVAAYPVAPSYAVEVEVGTPLNHVTYRYQGPGVGANAWVLVQSAPVIFRKIWQKALSAGAYPPAITSMPTITVSAANAATQISGGVAIANNDARIRYGSDMVVAGGSYPDYLFLRGRSVNYGSGGRINNRICPEFYTDAAQVEFQIKGTGPQVRCFVDGLFAGDISTIPNTGSLYRVLVDLGVGGVPRRIRFEAYTAWWGELRISPNAALWSVPTNSDIKALVLGDSFSEAAAGVTGLFGASDNWAARLGWMMGWGDTWISGVGATGYIAAPSGKLALKDRVSTDVPYGFDVIVVAMGINDNDTSANIQAAAESAFANIRAITSAPIFVVGAWNPKSVDVSARITGTKAAVATFANRNVFYLGDGFYNGTGRRGATTNNGNSDFYVAEDGTHPTLDGHKYLAERVRELILQTISPLVA